MKRCKQRFFILVACAFAAANISLMEVGKCEDLPQKMEMATNSNENSNAAQLSAMNAWNILRPGMTMNTFLDKLTEEDQLKYFVGSYRFEGSLPGGTVVFVCQYSSDICIELESVPLDTEEILTLFQITRDVGEEEQQSDHNSENGDMLSVVPTFRPVFVDEKEALICLMNQPIAIARIVMELTTR